MARTLHGRDRVERVDEHAQPRVRVTIEPHSQTRKFWNVVVRDLGFARGCGRDRAATQDVGELFVESCKRRVVGQMVHAQHEIAFDEPQRMVIPVEAGDLGERNLARRR